MAKRRKRLEIPLKSLVIAITRKFILLKIILGQKISCNLGNLYVSES